MHCAPSGHSKLPDAILERLVLLLSLLKRGVELVHLCADPRHLRLIHGRVPSCNRRGVCPEHAGGGGLIEVLALTEVGDRLCVQLRHALDLARRSVLLLHEPRVRLADALHRLLVVRLLLLHLVQRRLHTRREAVPLLSGGLQDPLLPPEVLLVVAAGDLRLLHLDLVQLALAVQEVLLEVLALLVRVLKLMAKVLLLGVERLHVHPQPLQLLHVHLVRLVAAVAHGRVRAEVLQPRPEDVPLLAQLARLRALGPGPPGLPRLPLRLEPLDLSPDALHLTLHRLVLPRHVVHLLLQPIRGQGGRRRRGAVRELVVQALDDLREASDGLDQLGLELLLLVVRVPQHLL
mmetsp:Transcript_19539/g.51756  ORF Transcript_19539/g.51756 Transcript_19539/m.51756 type:complete len:347 (-) Transcript_19539:1008-2048(-)